MNQSLLFLVAGLAGFIFQSLLRMKSLNDLSLAANIPFNPLKDYLIKDIYGICAAFLAPFIWLLIFGEIAQRFPQLKGFAVTSFFLMGCSGSYILQLALGRAKKDIRRIIDIKTDIADNKNQ